ncbi:MAG: glycosyl hydrolase 2 galactose-binding domain-containing protein, partial [Terracidiphilus sp.]
MKIRLDRLFLSALVAMFGALTPLAASAKPAPPQPVVLATGWRMQFANKVAQPAKQISAAGFNASGWYAATVPGTVLTTLVDDHVYPEPLYGENIRPNVIPESLAHTSYWYRTVIRVPRDYRGRRVWLNFDGINFSANVWVNGVEMGTIRGAFIRGLFDITDEVRPGKEAVVAVFVSPQPHPGV